MSTEDDPAPRTDLSTATFARVTGVVQGVNYRNATKRQADQLGLAGWVRNTADGDVEVLIGGADSAVDSLLTWCRTGPKRAAVESVDTREATADELATIEAGSFIVQR